MTATGVFKPRRFSRLVLSDAQNVSRDPILIFAIGLSLIMPVAVAVFRADIDAAAAAGLCVAGLSRYLAAVAFTLPAFLVGWVTGFLLLEDRDDGPLLAMEVTPVGKGGFFAYRVANTALIGVVIGIVTARLLFPELGWAMSVFLAALVAIEAIIVAFILLALASNKVEGLAITKLTNIGSIVPLVAVMPWPWRYGAGVVPSYWIGELIGLSPVAFLPLAASAVLAFGVHVAAAILMYKLAVSRLG